MGNLFDLSGTTAAITGSSRGIGLAIARALLGQGAAVLLNGHAPEETAQTLDLLAVEHPDRVAAYVTGAVLPVDGGYTAI